MYLSALARMADGAGIADVEAALYEQRTLLRLLAMRRTMFVVDRETAPVVLAAASRRVAGQERRKLVGFLDAIAVDDDVETWLAGAEAAALEGLAALGEATAPELAEHDPRLATELTLSPGKAYEATQKVVSRVLTVLGAEGRVVRARPRGGWTSTQFRWAAMERWCGGPLDDLPVDAAEAELARRWLAAFGPATVADLKWWTGWPLGVTRRALAAAGAVEVELDGGVAGVALGDDLEPVGEVTPWVALLPALDATPMGYRHRDFYLGEHAERVFDANGNVGPTVWCDGRIVGGWTRRPDGEIAYILLEDVGGEAVATIDAQAAALMARLGDARLAPRARGYSPVERELLA